MATLELRRQDLKTLELVVIARELNALALSAASTRKPTVIRELSLDFMYSLADAPEWRSHEARA